jgi:hypothetical protein
MKVVNRKYRKKIRIIWMKKKVFCFVNFSMRVKLVPRLRMAALSLSATLSRCDNEKRCPTGDFWGSGKQSNAQQS